MSLFTEQLNNWDDWGKVFHSIPAFKLLVEYIFNKESLLIAEIENLKPGTNAVFKVANMLLKYSRRKDWTMVSAQMLAWNCSV